MRASVDNPTGTPRRRMQLSPVVPERNKAKRLQPNRNKHADDSVGMATEHGHGL